LKEHRLDVCEPGLETQVPEIDGRVLVQPVVGSEMAGSYRKPHREVSVHGIGGPDPIGRARTLEGEDPLPEVSLVVGQSGEKVKAQALTHASRMHDQCCRKDGEGFHRVCRAKDRDWSSRNGCVRSAVHVTDIRAAVYLGRHIVYPSGAVGCERFNVQYVLNTVLLSGLLLLLIGSRLSPTAFPRKIFPLQPQKG
jgi:hypothetical protein